MRRNRAKLAATIIVTVVAAAPATAIAQDAEAPAPVPFTTSWEGVRWIDRADDILLVRIEGSSDARMDGMATIDWNSVEYPGVDGSDEFELTASSFRIENADGAWEGFAIEFGGTSDLYGGEIETLPMTVLTGEGDYAGLIAVVMDGDWADVKGVILPGPAPDLPAAVEIPA